MFGVQLQLSLAVECHTADPKLEDSDTDGKPQLHLDPSIFPVPDSPSHIRLSTQLSCSKHLKSLHIPLNPIQITQLQNPRINPSSISNLLDILNINSMML